MPIKRLLIIIAAVVSLIAIAWPANPYPWVFGSLAVLAALLFRWTAGRARWIAYNFIFVFLVLGGVELYLDQTQPREVEIITDYDPKVLRHRSDVMGIVHEPLQRVRWRRYAKLPGSRQEPIFDVHFTIDGHGRRTTPPRRGDESRCVLFFGGSLTFGSGVEDDEVTAHLVASLSQGSVATINFGFPGYGPNQMLSAIESDLLNSVNCRPTHAIYTAIPGHVLRVAGRIPWSQGSPRYVLDGTTVRRDGAFTGRHRSTLLPKSYRKLAKKSAIYRSFFESEAAARPEDYDLAAAVIRRSAAQLTGRYPGLRFTMITYRDLGRLGSLLDAEGVDIRPIEKIIPGHNKQEHSLSQYDGHPNPLAHRLLAEYILREVVDLEPRHILPPDISLP